MKPKGIKQVKISRLQWRALWFAILELEDMDNIPMTPGEMRSLRAIANAYEKGAKVTKNGRN